MVSDQPVVSFSWKAQVMGAEVPLYQTGETHCLGSGAAGAWLAVVHEQVEESFSQVTVACPRARFHAAW
ncbi:hypothetical protein GXW82_14155 [Streptacidiphilus sp. 4-A2]|nr:hypothetical protein [Streptacidiphilus sp. 4-A2]